MPAATPTALFAVRDAKAVTLGLGPVKDFACRPMHRRMTWNLAIPSFNK